MARDVTKYIAECAHCGKNRSKSPDPKVQRSGLGQFGLFEEVSIDFIGPLPTDLIGNSYICGIICGFSRFMEAFATEGQSAVIAAHCLLSIFARYGLSRRIRSDRGTPFVNEIIAEFTRILDVQQVLTPPYRPQADGIEERHGGEVVRHLKALVRHPDIKPIWSVVLPLALRIMNKTYRHFLGCAPNDLVYLNPPDLDRGLFEPFRVHEETLPVTTEYMQHLVRAQEIMLDMSSMMLWKQQEKLRANMSEPEPSEFPVGSYVLLTYPTRPDSKLSDRLAGPYQVKNRQGNLMTLQDLTCERTLERDVERLVPFLHPGTPEDMLRLAAEDLSESEVDSILNHRGNFKKRSSLEFQVQWTDGEVSWEPWDTVKRLELVTVYLTQQYEIHRDAAIKRLLV